MIALDCSQVMTASGAPADRQVSIGSVQVVAPESLYALALPGNFTQTYIGSGVSYEGPRRSGMR